MTTRRDSVALIGIILAFKERVFALELFATGQQSLQASLIEGIDSPKLSHSGRMCRFDFRAGICDFSNCTLASNILSSSKSWLLILRSGQQSRKFTRIMTSPAYSNNDFAMGCSPQVILGSRPAVP
jgi:hypothetical protein